jgi:Rrf2 family protein
MKLTRESAYALRGLAVLARRPTGDVVSLADVADSEGLPQTFLAKTFQKLARHGMLDAHRGPGRGYALSRDAADISIRDVLEAIEGDDLFRRCLFLSSHCSDEHPCPLHERLKDTVAGLRSAVERLTLADLADSRLAGARVESDHRTARGDNDQVDG